MSWKKEYKWLIAGTCVFFASYFLPGWERFDNAVRESLCLLGEYAREHVVLCLLPALFIAGAIGVFISQASVMKYLGVRANKVLAYGVASVSGSILAVCSCTVLPLFAGIYRVGAGLGPATAFLYAGPAINVLAIILTARVLGFEIGVARAVGAIVFSIVIGLLMHVIFRKEELEKAAAQADMPEPEVKRPLWQNVIFFGTMVLVLVFANWAPPKGDNRIWEAVFSAKWAITSVSAVGLGVVLILWFEFKWFGPLAVGILATVLALLTKNPLIAVGGAVIGFSAVASASKGEPREWFSSTWTFAKQILPLLFFGVLFAGFLLGRHEHEGLIPGKYVEMLVGDTPYTFFAVTGWGGGAFESIVTGVWPLWTNFFASIAGAFMYFATLTEVPIVQGLRDNGMGNGPTLALLLAGPALSLPNMLVIRSVMGTKKTVVFIALVVVMATISGLIFGAIYPG